MIERAFPGFKQRLALHQSLGATLRVAVFSLNAGGMLAFSGIYASLVRPTSESELPTWLVAAVASFGLGVAVFLVSLLLARLLLWKQMWHRDMRWFLRAFGHVLSYSAWGEWGCLLVGAGAALAGFSGVLS